MQNAGWGAVTSTRWPFSVEKGFLPNLPGSKHLLFPLRRPSPRNCHDPSREDVRVYTHLVHSGVHSHPSGEGLTDWFFLAQTPFLWPVGQGRGRGHLPKPDTKFFLIHFPSQLWSNFIGPQGGRVPVFPVVVDFIPAKLFPVIPVICCLNGLSDKMDFSEVILLLFFFATLVEISSHYSNILQQKNQTMIYDSGKTLTPKILLCRPKNDENPGKKLLVKLWTRWNLVSGKLWSKCWIFRSRNNFPAKI